MDSTELVSLRELARRIGKNVATVRKWRDREGLPVHRIGKCQCVLWSQYQEWLDTKLIQNRTSSLMH